MKKTFFAFLFATIICTIICVGISAQDTSDNSYTIDCTSGYDFDYTPRVTLYASDNTSWHFLPDEDISAYFILEGDAEIASIEYSSDGVTTNYHINESKKRVNVSIECAQEQVECSVFFEFTLDNGTKLFENVYLVNTKYGVFLSTADMAAARYKYFGFALGEGILTDSELGKIIYSLDNGIDVDYTGEFTDGLGMITVDNFDTVIMGNGETTDTTSTSDENIITVQGTLRWQDDSGYWYPLRLTKVAIYDGNNLLGDTLLTTVITDENGNYYASITNKTEWYDLEDGGYDIFVRVYAGDESDKVTNSTGAEYYYQSAIYQNYASSLPIQYSIQINMNDVKGQAFQIWQAVAIAKKYCISMLSRHEPVSVVYPYEKINETDSETSHYSSSIDTIFILKNDDDYTISTYGAWDVIMHEYGHHVEYMLGIINSPGGLHYDNRNMMDEYYNDSSLNHTHDAKSAGMRIAWSEGWATVFGLMAQQYFCEYTKDITNEHCIIGAGDEKFHNYQNGDDISIESPVKYLGDGCEKSVAAVLWDMYDVADSERDSKDAIMLGHQEYWKITTYYHSDTVSDKPKTLNQMVAYFYEYNSVDDIWKLGAILTEHHVSTSMPRLLGECSSSITPTFEWDILANSTHFPNNKFDLIFYNLSNVEIYRKTMLSDSSYKLTMTEWENILYQNPGESAFKVAVAAYQNETPLTGPYISNVLLMSKPYAETIVRTINYTPSTRYIEDKVTLRPGQCVEYYITCNVQTRLLMQTFGNKDTKMYLYDSNDVLLNESDDEGYTINSLIIRFLNANEQYKLKIEFYSSTTYGNTKLAITSPNGGTNLSVNSYIDSYESIATITGADNTRIGCTLATGRTWVTTFVPTQSAEYTIFTYEDDDVDTYLYLIDPRSSELLIYNVNQNDDAGEDFNAQIRSELEAGVKYLIVLSLYNPATIESSQVVFLTIERSGA